MKKNWLKNILYPTKEKNVYETTTIDLNKDNENSNVNLHTTQEINIKSPQILTPTAFNQVEQVANELLANKSVIVDLSNADKDVARRIVDFMSGVIFALDGDAKKIATLVYLFSPKVTKK